MPTTTLPKTTGRTNVEITNQTRFTVTRNSWRATIQAFLTGAPP